MNRINEAAPQSLSADVPSGPVPPFRASRPVLRRATLAARKAPRLTPLKMTGSRDSSPPRRYAGVARHIPYLTEAPSAVARHESTTAARLMDGPARTAQPRTIPPLPITDTRRALNTLARHYGVSLVFQKGVGKTGVGEPGRPSLGVVEMFGGHWSIRPRASVIHAPAAPGGPGGSSVEKRETTIEYRLQPNPYAAVHAFNILRLYAQGGDELAARYTWKAASEGNCYDATARQADPPREMSIVEAGESSGATAVPAAPRPRRH
jgi:hypothetical protein